MIEIDNPIYSRLLVCSDFRERCRDRNTCHICLQPRAEHPSDDDLEYWAQWLVFHSLLDLFCLQEIDGRIEIVGEKESLQ